MSGKQDLVMNNFYATHLNGGRKNNRGINQQATTEQMYVRILTELCANRFEWKGFDSSVDKRFLELNLIWRGVVVFYKDRDAGRYFVVQGAGSGNTNFMDNPTSFTVIGPNMQSQRLSATATWELDEPTGDALTRRPAECVPIYCNYMRVPDLDVIYLYATKLAKMDRSIEITADNMRKPKVIAASENERLSALNALKSLNQGDEAIFVTDSGVLPSMMQVLDLGVDPLTLPNLMIAKSKLWNECMGLLGINNANQDKKERLVAAEVGANDEQVEATRNIALNARQQACEEINELFGLNITVDFKTAPAPAGDAPGEEFTGGTGKPAKDEETA